YDYQPNSIQNHHQQQQQQPLNHHLEQHQQVQQLQQPLPELGSSGGPLHGLSFLEQPLVDAQQPSTAMPTAMPTAVPTAMPTTMPTASMPPGIGPADDQQTAPGRVGWSPLADAPFSLSSDPSGIAAASSGMPLGGAEDSSQAFSLLQQQQQQLQLLQQQNDSSNSYLHPTTGGSLAGGPLVGGFSTGGGGGSGGLSTGGGGGTRGMPDTAVRDVLGISPVTMGASAEGPSTLPSPTVPVVAAATSAGRWTRYMHEGKPYWNDGTES
ncbi:unnamed protein product, partial [Laminaria digitata]